LGWQIPKCGERKKSPVPERIFVKAARIAAQRYDKAAEWHSAVS